MLNLGPTNYEFRFRPLIKQSPLVNVDILVKLNNLKNHIFL
jgi:hypothetical protein